MEELKFSEKITLFLERENKTKSWLCRELDITYPTLKARMSDDNWRMDQIKILAMLGIV